MSREQIDKEIAYAADGNRHKSIRLVTAKRLLAATDAKTEALKTIHRLCNLVLGDEDGEVSFSLIKQIRHIAGKAYPPLEPPPAELRKEDEP